MSSPFAIPRDCVYWTYRHSRLGCMPLGIDSQTSGRCVLDSIRHQQPTGRMEASGKRVRPDRYELHDVVTGERMDQDTIIPSRISVQVRRRPAHDCQPIVSKHTVFVSPNGSWTVSPNGSWPGDQFQGKAVLSTAESNGPDSAQPCERVGNRGVDTKQAPSPPSKKARQHYSQCHGWRGADGDAGAQYSASLCCRLTGKPFEEPVVTLCCGSTFSKVAIEQRGVCPNCNEAVRRTIPNRSVAAAVSAMVHAHQKQNMPPVPHEP